MRPPRLLPPLVLALAGLAVPVAAPAATEAEALAWLRDYLRIDTSNPPGNEHEAAALLRGILHRERIGTRLIVTAEGRTSLYARLEARQPAGGALVLMHHMDVVPAGPGWSRDPFAARLEEGVLWGRGALDSKSLGIAHLAAFVELARRGVELRRDVVFLALADEETGGSQGTAWLLERHPDLLRGAEAVLGEGGTNRVHRGRIGWWGIEVAQKRPLWLRVTASGRSGHGSTLNLHTAPHRLIRGLDRLLERPLQYRVTPAARAYFEALAPLESRRFAEIAADLDAIVADPEPSKRLLPGLPNYLLDTVQINALQAGESVNAAPEEASALIDVRLLPDTDSDRFLREIEAALGDSVRVEVILDAPPAEPSPTDGELYRCLSGLLAEEAPVVPAFIPGITDSRYFRQRGIAAYGFSPFALEGADLRGIHGPDERIPVGVFERGVERMIRLVLACAGA